MKRPASRAALAGVVSDCGFSYLVAASFSPSPGLLCSRLDIFSGVFGCDPGPTANVFDARIRGLSGFLSCMLSDMTGLGCSFVHAVGGILTNRHTYTEN